MANFFGEEGASLVVVQAKEASEVHAFTLTLSVSFTYGVVSLSDAVLSSICIRIFLFVDKTTMSTTAGEMKS